MAFSRVCFLPNDSLLPCWEPHGKRSPKPSASDVEAATKCLELPVTPDQLRAALHRLGLLEPPSLAAEFFNVDVRTVQRWLVGRPGVPWMAVVLLRIMIRSNISAEEATRVAAGF